MTWAGPRTRSTHVNGAPRCALGVKPPAAGEGGLQLPRRPRRRGFNLTRACPRAVLRADPRADERYVCCGQSPRARCRLDDLHIVGVARCLAEMKHPVKPRTHPEHASAFCNAMVRAAATDMLRPDVADGASPSIFRRPLSAQVNCARSPGGQLKLHVMRENRAVPAMARPRCIRRQPISCASGTAAAFSPSPARARC